MIIGLTGGIASGKSTASKYFAERGAYVIDSDKLGHRAYEPGTEAFAAVARTFGPEVVGADGRIDRKVLGGKVFGRPEELKKLTDIVWPEIRRLTQLEIQAALAEDPDRVVVLEAAVMLEAGWNRSTDEVWVVIVEPDIAVARAVARDGLDPAAVRSRIASQLSNAERIARADVVIDNSGTLEEFMSRLEAAWDALETRRAAQEPAR
ncbi:MAG: dephospho-CoA kinase [Pseudomonadales bacterium]|nr:dephospho-CoA kinase [Pseudomonadales bacterium]